ncbi:MAG: aldolase [Angelakisella sp.]
MYEYHHLDVLKKTRLVPVVDWCIAHDIDEFPGCVTPSDLEQLLQKGLTVAKFFPAEAFGGVKVLKAFAGPYADIQFMPTGGIHEKNVRDYLALPTVLACGGAWMAPEALVTNGEFEQIAQLCRQGVRGLTD